MMSCEQCNRIPCECSERVESSQETYHELNQQLAEALRNKLEIEHQRNSAITALEEAIDLVEGCTVIWVPFGYSKTLKRIKEVLSTLQPPS